MIAGGRYLELFRVTQYDSGVGFHQFLTQTASVIPIDKWMIVRNENNQSHYKVIA